MWIALFLFGCSTDPAATAPSETTPLDETPAICEAPPSSACDNQGSVIVGEVALPPDHDGPTTGDLVIYLNHASVFGNAEGGGFLHFATRLADVDLTTGPVEFELDMCDGGAMWSEHNCGYALIGILDQNGNNDFDPYTFAANPVPDPGEPAFRLELDLRCDDPVEHCVRAVLDCRGPSCAAGEDQGICACEETTCQSIAAGCQ